MNRLTRCALLAAVTILMCFARDLPAQKKPHYPDLSQVQYYLSCRYEVGGKAQVTDVPIRIPSPLIPWRPEQVVELPAPHPKITIKRYLPRAELTQTATPDPTGKAPPCIRLVLQNPNRTISRWLVAGDVRRSRMFSMIGSWRFSVAADDAQRSQLFEAYEREFFREPMVVLTPPGSTKPVRIPASAAEPKAVTLLGYTVRVKAFHPHFGPDPKTGKPTNISDRLVNPAALVEVERAGKTQECWVFSRYPQVHRKQIAGMPFQLDLDSPVEVGASRPRLHLVLIAGDRIEVWQRRGEAVLSAQLAQGKPLPVEGSNYTFRVEEILPAAGIQEDYEISRASRALAALRIQVAEPEGEPWSMWLQLGRQQALPGEGGVIVVFGRRVRSDRQEPEGRTGAAGSR